jgi:hypothetical protein
VAPIGTFGSNVDDGYECRMVETQNQQIQCQAYIATSRDLEICFFAGVLPFDDAVSRSRRT